MKQQHLTQQHLKKHPEKLERFDKVRIHSKQWGAWWRANGAGYTDDLSQAGVYEVKDAWARVRDLGPEKGIVLQAA